MTKISNKKSIFYVLLLLAAGIGLALDRAHKPRSAAAATERSATSGVPATEDAEVGLATMGPRIAGIFDPNPVLDPVQQSESHIEMESHIETVDAFRDAFALTPMMREFYKIQSDSEKQKGADQAKGQNARAGQSAEGFKKTYHLKGTFLLPNDVWAVVNDRIVRIGDRLGDFELRKIERYRVVFVRENIEVVIELPSALDLKSIRQQNDGQ